MKTQEESRLTIEIKHYDGDLNMRTYQVNFKISNKIGKKLLHEIFNIPGVVEVYIKQNEFTVRIANSFDWHTTQLKVIMIIDEVKSQISKV